ncbi:MAG: prephenate dehydrogenase/arogenate dehydrogenase family protein [bacterium]
MKTKKIIAIYGLGLIGGSLGLALKQKGYYRIGIGRNPKKLAAAFTLGAADMVTTDVRDGVKHADIVVLALPVDRISAALNTIKPWIKKQTIVTDAGSVKGCIMRDAARILPAQFIGSHPMAGSEKSGIHYASGSLFKSAGCVVVPGTKNPKALAEITGLWKQAGAEVIVTDAETHDYMVAVCSHIPHILAYAMMEFVGTLAKENPSILKVPAGSFKDMTRVAMSNPEMWAQILQSNKHQIMRALRMFNTHVKNILSSIDKKNKSSAIFKRAGDSRKKMALHG